MNCFGRQKIYSSVQNVTLDNVSQVIDKAMQVHTVNRMEMSYLYDYYRGITPVLNKQKEVRPSINNKINVNRAYEIVHFFLGYGYGEPFKYTNRASLEKSDDIARLNDIMSACNKPFLDNRLAFWRLICGTAYRFAIPTDKENGRIRIFSKDPLYTFVIYRNDITEDPLCAVVYTEDEVRNKYFTVYTEKECFHYHPSTNELYRDETYISTGGIPIVEYPLNESRLGVFEPVIPLMDAISMLESNALDDVQQSVNSFLTITGGQISEETLKQLESLKTLCVPEGVNVKYISAEVDGGGIQTLIDSLYKDILTIVGMPSRNSDTGASSADTGQGVILRNGWSNAECYSKTDEAYFIYSERIFLKKVLAILRLTSNDINLAVNDIDIASNRHNTENLVSKTQAMMNMMSAGIAPEVYISSCNIWSDPMSVYQQSIPYLNNNDKTGTDTEAISST